VYYYTACREIKIKIKLSAPPRFWFFARLQPEAQFFSKPEINSHGINTLYQFAHTMLLLQLLTFE